MVSTTRRSSLSSIERHIKYAYLATLLGVVLATITTVYTTIRSFLLSQTSRSRPLVTSGNFTGTRQFGNFTGARQFANINPYGGFVNNFAILAVIIAIVGVLWLGLLLRKRHSWASWEWECECERWAEERVESPKYSACASRGRDHSSRNRIILSVLPLHPGTRVHANVPIQHAQILSISAND